MAPPDAPHTNDTDGPSMALVIDSWLGGDHHGEQEKALADAFAVAGPYLPWLVRANRRMLGRVVRYCLRKGVRQFLDLGSGVPAKGHVHEVVQEAGADASVVYVDNHPRVAEFARQVLAGVDNAVFIEADVACPPDVLVAPGLNDMIDFDEPVALTMMDTLLFVPEDKRPNELVAAYVDALSPGSYVAIGHSCNNAPLRTVFERFDTMKLAHRPAVHLRTPLDLEDYLAGLDLVDPGVVPIPLWQPDVDDEPDQHPDLVHIYVGVARKP